MKILELPIAELKQALAGLSKVIEARSHLPILAHLRVEPDGSDAVWLQGTDLEAFATCRIPARNIDQFGSCTVAFDPLNKLVKASKGDMSLIQEDGKLSVRYPIGGSLAKTPIESLPVNEWPAMPVFKSPATVLEEAFKPALKQALECSSKESSRYALNGACLDITQPDCHTVVGTDGRHLFSANTFTFQLSNSVIVPNHKFINWSAFAEDGPWKLAVELDKDNKPAWVKVESNRWTFITKAIDALYPNYRQVIPGGDGKTRVTFSPEAVTTILEALPCLPTWSELNLPVRLEGNENEFRLMGRVKEDENWTIVPVPGVRVVGLPFHITLNRLLVSKALRFGFTELDIYSDMDPVRFHGPGRKMIISHQCYEVQTKTTEPTQTQPPAQVDAPPVPQPENQERKTVSTTTITAPERGNLKTHDNNALKTINDNLERIKGSLRDLIGELASTVDLLKSVEKEKKAALKEVENVRTTLRSLQKMQI